MLHHGSYYYWKKRAKELGPLPPLPRRRSTSWDPYYEPPYYSSSSYDSSRNRLYYDGTEMRRMEAPRSAASSPYPKRVQFNDGAQPLGFEGQGMYLIPPQQCSTCPVQTSPVLLQVQPIPLAPPHQYYHSTNYVYQPQVQQSFVSQTVNYQPFPCNPPPQNAPTSGYYQAPVMAAPQPVPPPPPMNVYQQQAFNPDYGK